VIDVQNGFLPGGSLAVNDGDQVVPVINKDRPEFANVVITQDWAQPPTRFLRIGPSRQEAVRDD